MSTVGYKLAVGGILLVFVLLPLSLGRVTEGKFVVVEGLNERRKSVFSFDDGETLLIVCDGIEDGIKEEVGDEEDETTFAIVSLSHVGPRDMLG